MKKILIAVTVGLSASWCSSVYGNDLPLVKIDIHKKQVVRIVDKNLFGLNYDWIGMQKLFPHAGDGESSAIKLLRDLKMPLNRMAGTDSQRFHWKEAIGPFSHRKSQKLADWAPEKPILFGLLEWIDFCQRIDPNAKFVWVINLATDTPKDAADLVEFLTGDPSMNPNGGINWAEKRVEYGHPKPVPIAIWELGNEMDWGKHPWDVKRYIKVSRSTIEAMRKVNPNLHFAAQAITAPFDISRRFARENIYHWQRSVLKELGPSLNYIAIHSYFDGVPISKWDRFSKVLQDDIRKITGSTHIKIFDSEYATWPHRELALGTGHLFKLSMEDSQSLRGCLSTADYFVSLLRSSQTTAACYHAFASGPWAIIRRDKRTGKYFTTGIFDLFKLLEWAFPPGSRVVKTDIIAIKNGDNGLHSSKLKVLAAITSKGINIAIINSDQRKDANLRFNFKRRFIVNEEKILTGDSLKSVNTPRKKGIHVDTIYSSSNKPLSILHIIPKSVSFIKLVTKT